MMISRYQSHPPTVTHLSQCLNVDYIPKLAHGYIAHIEKKGTQKK